MTEAAAITADKQTRSRSNKWLMALRERGPIVLLFLPPALLLFTLFVALPMTEAASYSLYDWSGYGAPVDFVGFRNFEQLFTNRVFKTALINNGLAIIATLAIMLPLALGVAALLVDKVRGTTTFRLIFFMPFVLAEVATGLIWRFVYDGDYGLFAKIWELFGATPPYVLADRGIAMYAILVVVIWKYFGFHMMLYISGIQQIDRSLYEAAKIDGATGWQMFSKITVPLLGPTIRLSVFFGILSSLQLFDLIMPLTRGGPSDSTQSMVTYLYSFGIGRMQIGFGSAVGIVLFVVCAVFAFGYKRILMRND